MIVIGGTFLLLTLEFSSFLQAKTSTEVLPVLSAKETENLYAFMIDFYVEQMSISTRLEQAFLNLDKAILLSKTSPDDNAAFSKRIDNHVRQAAEIYGDLMRLKILFATRGKEILPSNEHETLLFTVLDFQVNVTDMLLDMLDFTFPFYEIDLPKKQMASILTLQSDMQQNLINLERGQKSLIYDLREQITSPQPDQKVIDTLIGKIVENSVEIIEENLNYKFALKNELSPIQTKRLFQILVMPPTN
jgi:hypothetical protein